MKTYKPHKTLRSVGTGAIPALVMAIATSSAVSPASAASVRHTFATQLQAVSSEHYHGQEFLTLQIANHVGPAHCRSNVLKIDVNRLPSEQQRDDLETVAFSAMLNDDSVLITVPLGYGDCVDGKPTVADMYLLINQ